MKLMTLTACLALSAWLAPVLPVPHLPATGAPQDPPPVDATVTGSGEIVSVSLLPAHALRFRASRGTGETSFDLALDTLPDGARIVGAQLGAFGPHGLAVALSIERGAETEYRWLYTAGDPLRGRLVAGDPLPPPQAPASADPWTLSAPLFTSTGDAYRLVDIHNPGGDSLELTFRRGTLQGVRQPGGGLAVDERFVHDVCPLPGPAMPGRSIQASVERVVRAP